MIRSPAVAGQFYPASAAEIDRELAAYIPHVSQKLAAIGAVVPHAGWMYSGPTAGIAYSRLQIPDRVILIGPNHHGLGSRYALFAAGSWRLPGAEVKIAEPLAAALLDQCKWLTDDPRAHTLEHCLEVQVPMLLRVNPNVQIVPLLIGGGWPEADDRSQLRDIGHAIARVVRDSGQPVLLIASSDMNHYEDQRTTRRKDKLALDAILSLDEERLLDEVRRADISMCGVVPAYIVLVASKQLGARHAELLDYRTSGDVSGDYSAVVGYAAVAIY